MTSSNRTRIGFVGTGIMGGHMARRLARAGFSVKAWNRTADKAEALVADGVSIAGTAAEAAANADVVICMLSSGPVCDEVLLGDGGVLAAMRVGSTLVVMSSIPVETARSQAAEASALNVRYVDAPVSGGEKGAREGTLAIMAGGEADDVAALADVFAPMGRVTHVGPVGAGELAKLANQLIVASNICAVAEALVLAESGGADPARVREALLGGFAELDRVSPARPAHGRRKFRSRRACKIPGQGHRHSAGAPRMSKIAGGPAKYQVKDTGTALESPVPSD